MDVVLHRFRMEDSFTLGSFICYDKGLKKWECLSLELPWVDNQKGKSCIPAGLYYCTWTYSPKMEKRTYEIQHVPGRSGIRIHSANFAIKELKGCISLGTKHIDIDNDGSIDIINSRDTVKAFNQLLAGKSFKLSIT